jgi:LytS/YehU family sensor histidine kinase
VHLLVALGWSVAGYYANVVVAPGWEPLTATWTVSSVSRNLLPGYLVLVVLMHVVAAVRASRSREVAALREASLHTRAQLQVLKMELQPHFLFNAMHSISALMHRDVKAANEMLVLLSSLLRRAVETVRSQEVSLQEEIEMAELYLQIEQVRFSDRLAVLWDIAPDARSARVPHMLLQPLIENSIKHGVESRSGAALIEISARRDESSLHVEVRDNGRGLSPCQATRGTGVGLSNTRERLAQLYGDAQGLTLTGAAGGGAVAAIRLPYTRADLREGANAAADSRAGSRR